MCTEDYSEIIVQDCTYKTKLTTNYKNRKKWEAKNPNHIIVTLPGTIRKIEVKIGQKVEAGEELLILEAMKMLNKIVSPKNGTIKKINIEVDQAVPKGYVMIELED